MPDRNISADCNMVIEKLFDYELIDFELLHVTLHLDKVLFHGHDLTCCFSCVTKGVLKL